MSATNRGWAWLLLAGCTGGGDPVEVTEIRAEVARDVATVVTVTFTTSEAVSATVVFGVDGALDHVTPPTASGTGHAAMLLGIPADREISYAIVVDGEQSEVSTVLTEALPADIPTATTTGSHDGYVLTTHTTDAGDWVLMFDPLGQIVWYHLDDRGLSIYRAYPLRDGSGIVYASAIVRGGPAPDSAFVRVSWDGSTESEQPVPDLAHDFVERDDGALVSLRYETRDGVLGNDVVAVGLDASVTQLWSAWDCWDPVTQPGDDPEHGWTHTNALDYDAGSGLYVVGVRNFATIAAVDVDSRTCPWGFGGVGGTVALEGSAFIHQHQFDWTGDRMLVFDNDGAPGNASRAVEYTYDAAAGTAAFQAVFQPDPSLYSFIMGDVHRRADGSTMVLYSVPGVILRFDPDGTETWRLSFDEGGPLGFMSDLASPYAAD